MPRLHLISVQKVLCKIHVYVKKAFTWCYHVKCNTAFNSECIFLFIVTLCNWKLQGRNYSAYTKLNFIELWKIYNWKTINHICIFVLRCIMHLGEQPMTYQNWADSSLMLKEWCRFRPIPGTLGYVYRDGIMPLLNETMAKISQAIWQRLAPMC